MILPDAKTLRQLLKDNDGRLIFQAVLPIDGTPSLPYREPETAPIPVGAGATHSEDFASVNWFGTVYSFTRPQAEIVSALWNAWRDGCPFLSQQTLLTCANSEGFRLRDCFKNHPAWGTMVRHGPSCGGTMGTYRLLPPGGDGF